MGRMSRLSGALASLAWTGVLLIGLPAALVRLVGWPFPHHVPTQDEWAAFVAQPLTRGFVLAAVAAVGWAMWSGLLAVALAEGYRRIAHLHRRLPHLRLPGPLQSLSAAMLGTVAVSSSVGTVTMPAAAHAAVATDDRHQPQATDLPDCHPHRPVTVQPPAPATRAPSTSDNSAEAPARTRNTTDDAPGGVYHVVNGDSLWGIARQQLGNPLRWRDIYVLNRGKPQVNGYALTDPDEIHIGWKLILPTRTAATPPAEVAGGPPTPAAATPQAASATPAPRTPAAPAPTPASPAPASPVPQPAVPDQASPSASPGSSTPTPSPDRTDRHSAPQHSQSAHRHGEQDGGEHSGAEQNSRRGVSLPSAGWVSLGLAATIAAVAALLRLQRRRRARLRFPIPLGMQAASSPVPESLYGADAAGSGRLTSRVDGWLPGLTPATPEVAAPIGVDANGDEISLFALPGPAVALHGPGAPAATRAVLASVLTTGVADELPARPTVVVSAELLAALLPAGTDPVGLDPAHVTFDGERLHVVTDTAAAITHLEEEIIHRRRLLDDMSVDSVAELNAGTRHLEFLPPYVLLAPTDPRYTARLLAVATHRTALQLHPVLLGIADGLPEYKVAADGTLTAAPQDAALDGGRLATLSPRDLADVLAMVARVAARPETGDAPTDDEPSAPDTDPATTQTPIDVTVELPEVAQPRADDASAPPVQLRVLGTVTLATTAGPISIGRSGSRAVLAILAAHHRGHSFEEMAAVIHPNADPDSGVNRVRTDLNAVRSLLRDATGIEGRGKFIVYDSVSSRYRIDPNLIDVDLWHMLAALDRANKASDDQTCLAALRDAVDCYAGDFGEGQDWLWSIEYATTYRHQLLSAYARIAEILEADHPDQAVAALEAAINYDPVNEELYQRVIRIHGRLARPDAVRRTLRLLENRLADLGQAEPSDATRRIAERQLKPAYTTRTPT
jgi:DNA-binding SARP family transcriptional activator